MEQSKLDKLFHNLRNFPYWIILTPLYIFLILLYYYSGNEKIFDSSRDVLIALTTSIGLGRLMAQNVPSQSGTTEKGDVNLISPAVEKSKEGFIAKENEG